MNIHIPIYIILIVERHIILLKSTITLSLAVLSATASLAALSAITLAI